MKKVYIAILCFASTFIYADKTQNPYYALINETAGDFFRSLPSEDLDALLSNSIRPTSDTSIETKIVTKDTDDALFDLVHSFQEELICVYEQNKDKITNREEFLMFQMNYVNLALYRLIYEEAERRSLIIVAKVPKPNMLEDSVRREHAHQSEQSL
jgi:hypothetical protein